MKSIQLLLSTLMLLSSLAFAGEFHVAPVTIVVDGDAGRASGNLIAARFSENYCEASLGQGNDALCITYDPAMIDTIASINTFSFVYFEWKFDGTENICTHVTVATRSIHIPSKLKP